MKSFIEHLQEGKQVGTLYHYTNIEGLKGILNTNFISAMYGLESTNRISFTRDKNFHARVTATGVPTEVRITIDGNKLSQKYKITPYHDYRYFGNRTAQKYIDEMEESCSTRKIDNIDKYITEIKILIPDEKLYDETYNEYFPKYMKSIKSICQEKNITLYDSTGNKI